MIKLKNFHLMGDDELKRNHDYLADRIGLYTDSQRDLSDAEQNTLRAFESMMADLMYIANERKLDWGT